MNAKGAKALLLASQPSTSQPKTSPALPLPGSHVISVPVWMHHDLLHPHVLLGTIVLAQAVVSYHHTERHLAGVREGSPE